ncbi:hypothetical protein I550_3050 [Mycobacterium intracellulare 1956]|uniref:Uncharacterized protein n=1 Tax=Mycobacterium intracellulare 1956 TaxID=1299331 RepID=X8CI01_MYCIT|nr:hypothetical protein I550_3050 [Mycobacterium intracellulare 1956]
MRRAGFVGLARLQIATREFHLARLFGFVRGRQRRPRRVCHKSHLTA